RVREESDESEAGLLDARSDPVEEGELPQRREHDALVREPLDLVEQRFTTLRIELARLLDEEILHVGIPAPRVHAILHEVVLDSRRRVAVTDGARLHDGGDLLVLPAWEVRRALLRPH